MKKLFIIYSSFLGLFFFYTASVQAQHYTTVTATLTDSSSQVWTNALVIATFRPAPNVPGQSLNDGFAITDTPQTVITNGSGAFTLTLDDTNHVTPTGATWSFAIYPNATVAAASSITLGITGTSLNLTTTLSNTLIVPIVNTAPSVYRAYNNSEANGGEGAIYWNTTLNILEGCEYNGTNCTWLPIGSGSGGGTVTSVTESTGICLFPNPITTSGAIAICNTAVTPGTYTNATLVINAQGQITSATNGGGSLSGSGTAPFFPIWTGTTTLGNSLMQAVTTPSNGIQYTTSSGQYWQIDAGHLTFNTGVLGSGNIIISNAFTPTSGNQAGGIVLQAAPTSGEACAGNTYLYGGQNGTDTNVASIEVTGTCANGFGYTGATVYITGGTTPSNNTGGTIVLQAGNGGFGFGNIEMSGNGISTGCLSISFTVVSSTGSNCLTGTNISVNQVTLTSNASISANTLTSLASQGLTKTITFPSTGCPCRVLLAYGLSFSTTNSDFPVDALIYDGSNKMISGSSFMRSVNWGGLNASGYSISTYANNAVTTFIVEVESGGAFTIQQNTEFTGMPGWLQVSVQPSN